MDDAQRYLQTTFEESLETKKRFLDRFSPTLIQAAQLIGEAIGKGGKIMICGNGGSAADSQHMAAEMVGEMTVKGRRPLPAMALTTDTSNLTAVGNDFGYEFVFVKQVQALGRPGDVLVAISTSGNSKNVLAAVEAARQKQIKVIGLTGGTGGKLAPLCDHALIAELGKNSSRIQETHLFALHSLVDLVDRFYLPQAFRAGGA